MDRLRAAPARDYALIDFKLRGSPRKSLLLA